jgi:hypothetical protein
MPAGSTAHVQSTGNVPDTAPAPSDVAGRRRIIAVLIAIAWCAVLAILVLLSANPVTLNRRQIFDADALVAAQVLDPQSGACRVTRQWNDDPLPEQIVVERLHDTAVTEEGEWILPLQVRGDRLEIVPSLLPSGARLVYPATPDAVRQLEAILDEQARHAGAGA